MTSACGAAAGALGAIAVMLLLGSAVGAAAWLPARRALALPPLSALRAE